MIIDPRGASSARRLAPEGQESAAERGAGPSPARRSTQWRAMVLMPGRDRMGHSPDPLRRGRTRWRRFGIALSTGMAGTVGLLYLTAHGVIAMSITIPSNVPYTVNAKHLSGTDMVMKPTTVGGRQAMEMVIGHA